MISIWQNIILRIMNKGQQLLKKAKKIIPGGNQLLLSKRSGIIFTWSVASIL